MTLTSTNAETKGHHYPHGCDNWAPEMKQSNPLLRQTFAYAGPPRSSLMRAIYHQQKQAVVCRRYPI